MKLLLSLIVLIQTAILCNAQKDFVFPLDAATNKVSYSQVDDVANKSKAELFSAANKWMFSYNTSENLKVVKSFEEEGQIIAQGVFKVECSYSSLFSSCEGCRDYDLVYTLNVFVKDNKFKYEVTNLILQYKKGKRAMGLGAYGVVAGTIKEDEIIAKNLEEFYPVQKKACKDAWNEVFKDIDENINKAITSLTIALKKSETDW